MIHIKELRFGNMIQTREGEVIKVQQILDNTIIYETRIEVNREPVNSRKSSKTDFVIELSEVIEEADCQEVYPIQLTSEILKRCGFRNFLREEWIFSIGNSHIDFVFIDQTLKLRCPAPSLTNIRHVHQLQNLLFAIAEYELEIEL